MTPPIPTHTPKRRKPTQREIDAAYDEFERLENQPHLTLVPSHGGTDDSE